MRYLCIALFVALAALGWLYRGTKADLAVSEASVRLQAETISTLRGSIAATDRAVAAWDKDRTTLAGVRNTTRAAVKEAMQDENFKVWADTRVPPDVWRLLWEATGRTGLSDLAPHSPDAAGTGSAPAGKRN